MPDVSSADPQALLAYSQVGLRIDADLEPAGLRLEAALAAFAESCTEYSIGVGPELAWPLYDLTQRAQQSDHWVATVAHQFIAADSGPPPSQSGSSSSGIGDFFSGLFDEGKSMVSGLVNTVVHPITTAKGLWTAVTHPDLFWQALTEPYVEDWSTGHPWRAIGRGTMFIGSLLIGTKGADKIAELSKLSRAAEVSAGAAAIGASKGGSALEVAEALAKIDEGSQAEINAARFIANQSTETYGTVNRVVLGAYKPDPARNFLGYIGEAKAYGGKVFNTGDPVWNAISPSGRAWVVNREFLQSQMEQKVPRIELKGTTVSEVLSNPRTARSFRGLEAQYLQRYAYQYGYKLIDDHTWVRVGDWRASDLGRAFGAIFGPLGDLLHSAQDVAPNGSSP